MVGVITTGNTPKALWPGINAWFGRFYDEYPKEYIDLFDVQNSEKAYEEVVEVTGFGLAPIKPQGEAIEYDSETQQTIARFTHVAYAIGYIVTWEEQRDNQYEKVARTRTQALAFSMRQTKETVAANVYNRFGTSGYNGGDGVVLGSVSHPTVSGLQSNILSTAADLSEASLEDLTVQIMGAQNGRGLTIALQPRALIVSRQNWFEANRILKSVLQNDTANNAINALKATSAIPEGIKVNHYLTDVDAWFVRTNCPEGMILFDRDPLMFEQDNDGDTKNIKYNAYERYKAYWGDWRGLYGSIGA